MSESLGNLRWLKDRQSGPALEGKRREENINKSTPVWHVEGSDFYHPDTQCSRLAEEEKPNEKRPFARHGIGHLFGRLPDKDKLTMCMQCDRNKIKTIPKDNSYIP